MTESGFAGLSILDFDKDQISAKVMLKKEFVLPLIRHISLENRRIIYLRMLASDVFLHSIDKFNGDKSDAVTNIFKFVYQICMSKFHLKDPVFGDITINEEGEEIIASVTIKRQKINVISKLISALYKDGMDFEAQRTSEEFLLLCDIVFYLAYEIEGDNSDAVKSVLSKIYEICVARMFGSELYDVNLFFRIQ